MRHILSLDQGTTSSRAIVFNERGEPVVSAQREFRQFFPQSGWVEHDASEIWSSQLSVANEALERMKDARVGGGLDSIGAIAIANQRETVVMWDRTTGRPVSNAIVWQDHRTSSHCDALRARVGAESLVRNKTGLLLEAYFSATKIKWLLDSIPEARALAAQGRLACGTVDSWLVWNLTSGASHVTDVSNASRTLLFDIHKLQWDPELLDLFEIPESILPTVVASSGVVAKSDARVLGKSIPIAGIVGDQQSATVGQACFNAGMAKNTYGTGCFMLMNTGGKPVASANRLLTTVGWNGIDGRSTPSYCLEGAVFMGGATVQWLRDGLEIIQSAAEIEVLASQVPDTAEVYLVPAFAGLGAPYWDSSARGVLVGLSRGTTRAHVARAALEAMALQSVDVFEAMARDAQIDITELRVDGGASRNDVLMQMQADFLGVSVVRPQVTETTALGAAYLAGLAVGVWGSLEEVARQWRAERRFDPTFSEDNRLAKLDRWRMAVDRAKRWTQ